MTTTRTGNLTMAEFATLFPGQNIRHHILLDGTDAHGRPAPTTPDEVLESSRSADSGPSHQALFAHALLALDQNPHAKLPIDVLPIAQIQARCRSVDTITSTALEYLLHTADGGWDPEEYICLDMARLAFAAGVRPGDVLHPPAQPA